MVIRSGTIRYRLLWYLPRCRWESTWIADADQPMKRGYVFGAVLLLASQPIRSFIGGIIVESSTCWLMINASVWSYFMDKVNRHDEFLASRAVSRDRVAWALGSGSLGPFIGRFSYISIRSNLAIVSVYSRFGNLIDFSEGRDIVTRCNVITNQGSLLLRVWVWCFVWNSPETNYRW